MKKMPEQWKEAQLKPYHDARREADKSFEVFYLIRLLAEAKWNMGEAVRIAQINRTSLYRLLSRNGLTINKVRDLVFRRIPHGSYPMLEVDESMADVFAHPRFLELANETLSTLKESEEEPPGCLTGRQLELTAKNSWRYMSSKVRGHLESCSGCRSQYEEFRASMFGDTG